MKVDVQNARVFTMLVFMSCEWHQNRWYLRLSKYLFYTLRRFHATYLISLLLHVSSLGYILALYSIIGYHNQSCHLKKSCNLDFQWRFGWQQIFNMWEYLPCQCSCLLNGIKVVDIMDFQSIIFIKLYVTFI